MAIFTRVAPWLAFLLGQLMLGHTWASPFAALATAIIIGVEIARGARLGELILDGSSLVYFTLFSILSVMAPHHPVLAYVAAGAQLVYAAVIAIALAAGTPFTLPLARRGVPEEVGTSPEFIRFNRLLTLIWLASFLISGIVMVILMLFGVRDTWLQIAIIVASIIIPTVVQGRLVAKASER